MPSFFHHLHTTNDYFGGISGTGWSAITAIGTLLAVVVALGISMSQDRRNRAYLDFAINLIPPDCHKIIMQGPMVKFNVIYLRIRVQHLSGKPAENVEVMITNFWSIDNNGNKNRLSYFLPMNLVWSHFQPRTHVLRVPVGLFRHCDFGFISKQGEGTLLKLDTLTQPNPVEGGEVPNIIKPGKYQFELLLSGDNVKPRSKIFKIEIDGIWSNDESIMLREHIKISEI